MRNSSIPGLSLAAALFAGVLRPLLLGPLLLGPFLLGLFLLDLNPLGAQELYVSSATVDISDETVLITVGLDTGDDLEIQGYQWGLCISDDSVASLKLVSSSAIRRIPQTVPKYP